MTTPPKSPHASRPDHNAGPHPLPCHEIQDLMLDFMQHDLGDGRSDLVREHIRRCPDCQARFHELQHTLGILHDAPFARGVLPQHLSRRHHDRLVRAMMHPVLEWIYVHHILVSILIALIELAMTLAGLRRFQIWRESVAPGIPVVIGQPSEPAGDRAEPDDANAR